MKLTSGLFLILFFCNIGFCQTIDLSKANIVISTELNSPIKETAIQIIQEEVAARSKIHLTLKSNISKGVTLALAVKNSPEIPSEIKSELSELKKDGFAVAIQGTKDNELLWLIGNDNRGLIYAIGHFLKHANITENKITFNKANQIVSSPIYSIRGHQLGYRNTANSWDSWTVAQYEKYIRELKLFGANCIENIPHQDETLSISMKVPRDEMNQKISEICKKYDLDYWVWTPINSDISKEENFKKELEKHSKYYSICPKLDAVFFPCGDPGDNDIKDVLLFLKTLSVELKKYHPSAGIWISLQGLNDNQVDYFYEYLNTEKPEWLIGVVSGPSSPDIASTRYRLPNNYKHRHYPDITHTVRCQYPVEKWDQAFALTEGREVTNPRPNFSKKIHNRFAPFTDGFLSYSDGVHDDINKVVWAELAWNPDKNVREILIEYSRFFFGNNISELSADGILALERNWSGPIEENGGIETTFEFWKNLDAKSPSLSNNWRWQMLMLRVYYDTYIKRRKLYEQDLEKQANEILSKAKSIGAGQAMKLALEKVNLADKEPIAQDLRQKIVAYCESLYQSIGLQTSVKKYNASGAERGAILDFLDYPFNNRWWLADEFEKIKKLNSEKEKIEQIARIYEWENPGKGSYYDNVSDISKSQHVTTISEDGTDIAWWDNGMSRKRLSTQLFQNFPKLSYKDLDPNGSYMIRIAGYGEALLRVDGERIEPSVYKKGLEEFKEFHLTKKYVSDGKIEVSFDEPEESHLNWRQQSKICDIWLLKK